MNKKILGASIAAVFAVALVSSPIMADAITDLVKTKIKIDDDEYKKIEFKLAEKVPVNGEVFGGYAIFTDGDVIVVTSHQGAYDSEAQDFDNEETTFALCTPEQLAAGLCGPEWHSHLVKPISHPRCEFAAVGALTFEEPSDDTKAKGKKIKLKEIEIGTDEFTNSITGTEQDFTAGHPTSPDGVAFDLNAAFNGDGSLAAVCIGDVIPLDPPGAVNVIYQDASGNSIADALCRVSGTSGVDVKDSGFTNEDGEIQLFVEPTRTSILATCSTSNLANGCTASQGVLTPITLVVVEGDSTDCTFGL
ncbi:hypothetical protein C6988_10305 [Nitrosopumilus sp. b1]|uniref:hypothetical protein n=1 Tax=Nitrosopumilus sp. b1 TaxID=2109907 RepID=UPI0015F3E3D4|nr:hypothetical protein [Nitrosopumilus sp. b1]KAF6242058.1 hypothetical protein C6988_10305 [Nitrosopumilus sp. b1]